MTGVTPVFRDGALDDIGTGCIAAPGHGSGVPISAQIYRAGLSQTNWQVDIFRTERAIQATVVISRPKRQETENQSQIGTLLGISNPSRYRMMDSARHSNCSTSRKPPLRGTDAKGPWNSENVSRIRAIRIVDAIFELSLDRVLGPVFQGEGAGFCLPERPHASAKESYTNEPDRQINISGSGEQHCMGLERFNWVPLQMK